MQVLIVYFNHFAYFFGFTIAMQKHYRISIIGAGRVTWHLAPALENAGHTIQEVYSRRHAEAKKLTRRLYHAKVLDEPDFSDSSSDIFIIAVADDAISTVASRLILPAHEPVVVHTSGSQPLEALAGANTPYTGVFYPLQTFTKNKDVDFSQVPICLESEDSDVLKMLTKVAKSISPKVKLINSRERAVLHIAAVFACNFANHLLQMAETLLESQHMDLSLLKPLITETINNSLSLGPQQAQTGPAVRGDLVTLEKHMGFLKDFDQDYADIYKAITQHIIDTRYLDE